MKPQRKTTPQPFVGSALEMPKLVWENTNHKGGEMSPAVVDAIAAFVLMIVDVITSLIKALTKPKDKLPLT